jgi:DNA-binding transcriptional MerR regulator
VGVATNHKAWQLPHMAQEQLTELTFTAGEVELLTGVSPAQQRDWRRRKLLPATPTGWTQYTVADVASLLLMRVFADQGIGPAASRAAVDALAPPLAARVLRILGEAEGISSEPQVAIIWANREIETYATAQDGLDAASDAQQSGLVVIVQLKALAPPLAIQIRNHLQREP